MKFLFLRPGNYLAHLNPHMRLRVEGERAHRPVVVQSLFRPILGNSMDCSMLVFPALHYLLEFAQTHVHRVHDAVLCRFLHVPSIFLSIKVFFNELSHWSLVFFY